MSKLGSLMIVLTLAIGSFLIVGVPLPAKAASVPLTIYGSASAGWDSPVRPL